MKRYFLLPFFFMLITFGVKAQAPQSFNYQAVARDASGNIIQNQMLGVRVTLHQDTATGTMVYQETQKPITNQFGLFTMAVGEGSVTFGVFGSINWSTGNYWL